MPICYECTYCDKEFKKPHHVWFICIECHKEKIYESQSKLDGYISKIYNSLVIFCRKKGIENGISKEDLISAEEGQYANPDNLREICFVEYGDWESLNYD